MKTSDNLSLGVIHPLALVYNLMIIDAKTFTVIVKKSFLRQFVRCRWELSDPPLRHGKIKILNHDP